MDIGSDSDMERYYFDENAVMVSSKWIQIDSKWYYFYKDGTLAKSTTVDGYEVDENGVRNKVKYTRPNLPNGEVQSREAKAHSAMITWFQKLSKSLPSK